MTHETRSAVDGDDMLAMLAAATRWLERHAEAVNAINVYPVPDGDTGTNMHRTMVAALAEASRAGSDDAGAVAKATAHGALMGARGNGGVILSQIFRGVAQALGDRTSIDGRDFAEALVAGTGTAYRAVARPVEGTILTVVRDSAEAASAAGGSFDDALASAVDGARDSVRRTPELLPVLAQAGVVDAGGQGLYLILEGALRHLRGESDAAPAAMLGEVSAAWLTAGHDRETGFGYCTEFMISGERLDEARLRAQLSGSGESVLVAGDERTLRVHVHTQDPGAVLTLCAAAGRLRDVKVDDMEAQHRAAFERDVPRVGAAPPIGVVAVAAGAGWHAAFSELGAAAIVAGGQTMNPSTEELVDAIRRCGSPAVIVLPNNKNIVMAARQAAELAGVPALVVVSLSMPQGLAAMLAHNTERSPEDDAAAMAAAATAVRTVEVTHAVRDAAIGDVRVRAGQAIALVDDELRVAAESIPEAALQALHSVGGGSLITLYRGADVGEAEAEALAGMVRHAYPAAEVELVDGGQPHYHYIISAE